MLQLLKIQWIETFELNPMEFVNFARNQKIIACSIHSLNFQADDMSFTRSILVLKCFRSFAIRNMTQVGQFPRLSMTNASSLIQLFNWSNSDMWLKCLEMIRVSSSQWKFMIQSTESMVWISPVSWFEIHRVIGWKSAHKDNQWLFKLCNWVDCNSVTGWLDFRTGWLSSASGPGFSFNWQAERRPGIQWLNS